MTEHTVPVSDQLLLEVLALSKKAVAVYNSPDLHIRFANDTMLNIWGKDRSVIGKTFEEALPEIKGQAFTRLLQNVWRTGETYTAEGMPATLSLNGVLQTSYFDFEYRAVQNDKGQTYCLLHTATDVTERLKAWDLLKEQQRKEQELIEELATTNEELRAINEDFQVSEGRLKQMISAAPMGMTILKGRDLVIEIANEHMYLIWSRSKEQVNGKKLLDIFPELIDQPFPKMLDGIFDTGEPIAIAEIPVDIVEPGGNVKKLFVNFRYDPLIDPQGNVEAIVASVIDITQTVEDRKQLEQNKIQLQEFNEELSAINEEQASANEELRATNEELAETQAALKLSNDKLTESQNRLRDIFEQAPVGICVLSGPEHIIEIANEHILRIWGRQEDEVIGKRHHIARPELAGQAVYNWLDEVYQKGKRKINNEIRVMLHDNGTLREAFVNSVYQPITDADGNVNGILVILDEITEKVKARQASQRAQDMFNMAIEAGELGTFYYDPNTNTFSGNDILKGWFGLQPDDEIDLAMATGVIAEEDRAMVVNAIKRALTFESGGNYEAEYTILNPESGIPRIVKAKGKTIFDADNKALSLNGTVQDITERKKDEQRKNDFIAMVSHELKTPLTSINAYLQILHTKSLKANDEFASGALDKAGKQIKKMTNMINGFLNVSRLESGKIHIDKRRFDMAQLFKEIQEEIEATVSTHHVRFRADGEIMTDADRDKVGQVINNLISNAVKYSAPGTVIEVDYHKTDKNHIQVSVKDEGTGIKQHDLDKLFDRYYRVEESLKTVSGFGIGLYLCAEIIQRHNGLIWVDSEYGVGSTFYFSLPLE